MRGILVVFRDLLTWQQEIRTVASFLCRFLRVFPLCAVLVWTAGCTISRRLATLDREVQEYIKATEAEVLPGRPSTGIALDAYRPAAAEFIAGIPSVLDLRTALVLAARHSRSYQSAREALYTNAIGLWAESRDWEWNITNSVSALIGRDLSVPETTLGGEGSLGLTRRLVSGARLSASLTVGALRYLSGRGDVNISSLASLTLTQPLLSGSGRLVAREPLTQAERGLVYALRTYVRKRKALVLEVADDYYTVLSAMDGLATAERSYENLRASRERSELLADSGRLPPFQVDQALQDELRARATVISQRQALDANLDRLRRTLGLPLNTELALDRTELTRLEGAELAPPPMSFAAALALALRQRLDYATARDELEDAERAARIAYDDARAKLDLTVSGRASAPPATRLRALAWDQGDYSAGVDAELPFNRTAEIAAHKRALVALARERRAVAEFRDTIEAELRSDWRTLQSAMQTYEIQRRSLDLAERRIERLELLLEAGRVEMRDVLDARDSLTEARNALTRALVTHRLSWLRLQYDLERLSTDPETLWSEALELSDAGVGGESDDEN